MPRTAGVGAYSDAVTSPFDTIAGLPTHVLVVHAVVALVPLLVVCAVLMVARIRFSRRFGPLVLAIGFVAVLASIVARLAGEQLALRVGVPATHQSFGQWVPWAVVVLYGLVLGFWLADRGIPTNRPRPAWLMALGAVVVFGAVGTMILTVVAGHTGSVAVWAPVISPT